MKATFKQEILDHNCEEHLKSEYWSENCMTVEEIRCCSICGRTKYHWAYGELLIND